MPCKVPVIPALRALLVLLVLSGFLAGGCAAAGDRAVDVTRWQVLYSQAPSVEAAEEKGGWRPVTLPCMMVLPYGPKRDIQYLWFRGEFTVKDPGDYYGISLGRLYYTDRVYINGRLAGSHTTTPIQDLHYPRNYEIPAGALVPGKNRVQVYLGIYGREYGGIPGRVQVQSKDLFIRTSILMEFLYRQVPVTILLLFLFGAFFILCEFLWRGREARSIIVLMIFLLWISYLASIFCPYYPFGIDFRITLLWTSACLIPIFFFLYIQYYYRIFHTAMNMVFIPVLVICSTLSVMNVDTTSPFYLGRALGFFAVAAALPAHVYLLYYLYRRRPDRTLLYFIVLGLLPGAAIAWDIINYLFVYHLPPLYHVYTLPMIVVLFIILRISGTMKRQVQLEILYRDLKLSLAGEPDQPEAGAAAPQSLAGKPVVTPAMEARLGKVIDFLKINYLADITREGVARTMGLGQDRLNALFQACAGYKIGDYINKLRIEDAARQLKNSDRKIIDIAFSVGFESLVTFNRAFLKVIDMTPSEYRKKRDEKDTNIP